MPVGRSSGAPVAWLICLCVLWLPAEAAFAQEVGGGSALLEGPVDTAALQKLERARSLRRWRALLSPLAGLSAGVGMAVATTLAFNVACDGRASVALTTLTADCLFGLMGSQILLIPAASALGVSALSSPLGGLGELRGSWGMSAYFFTGAVLTAALSGEGALWVAPLVAAAGATLGYEATSIRAENALLTALGRWPHLRISPGTSGAGGATLWLAWRR